MKSGQQLQSLVCKCKIIVLRPPKDDMVAISCGGSLMVDTASAQLNDVKAADPDLMGGTSMGKRYSDPVSGLQVLCVTGGDGTLTVGGRAMELEIAKQLPSSD